MNFSFVGGRRITGKCHPGRGCTTLLYTHYSFGSSICFFWLHNFKYAVVIFSFWEKEKLIALYRIPTGGFFHVTYRRHIDAFAERSSFKQFYHHQIFIPLAYPDGRPEAPLT